MNQSYRMLSVCGHQIGALSLNAPGTPGPPIILLHGVMSSMRYWTPDQTELFTGHFHECLPRLRSPWRRPMLLGGRLPCSALESQATGDAAKG